MIALDTNVLVRYLANDNATQSARAASLIESFTAQAPGFIPLVTALETVWVMESVYGATRSEIAAIITQLLGTQSLIVEHAASLRIAVAQFAKGKADFADYLIAASAQTNGAVETVTFDKRTARDAGMRLIVGEALRK